MNFNSIEQALAFIQNTIVPQVLETTVADVAKETMERHIQEDVLDAYAPTSYERTGLLQKSCETTMISNNTLELKNTREENGKDIVSTIEYGTDYYTKELDERIGARPFTERTKEELSSGLARQAIVEGLEAILGKGSVV